MRRIATAKSPQGDSPGRVLDESLRRILRVSKDEIKEQEQREREQGARAAIEPKERKPR